MQALQVDDMVSLAGVFYRDTRHMEKLEGTEYMGYSMSPVQLRMLC